MNQQSRFLTKSDTNLSVQSQEKARSLKFQTEKGDESSYLWGKNKGADQLCSYCTADLHLCFCIGRLFCFSS